MMTTKQGLHTNSSNGAQPEPGPAVRERMRGRGPAVWLAGDPEDLKKWMPLGAAGVVTNTVVLNQMVQKYGQIRGVVQRYLDITEKPVVVEIDGHTGQELLDVGRSFVDMAPERIILKIPTTAHGLEAISRFSEEGVQTASTTVFSVNQAVALARAGVNHVYPFCEPVKQVGGDGTRVIRECVSVFSGWADRPYITAALVRTAETAYEALRDGADGIIIFWPIFEQMLQHPLTDQWNQTFWNEWEAMREAGLMDGVPVHAEH